MTRAMYAARLRVAARYGTALFVLLGAFAGLALGEWGLLVFTGVLIFGVMWFATSREYKQLTEPLKVGEINRGDVDDTIGFSRLNVALDDAVLGEKAGTVTEEMRAEIAKVLSELPARFDHEQASRASDLVNDILAGKTVTV